MQRETASFSNIKYNELDVWEQWDFQMDNQEFKNLHELADANIMAQNSTVADDQDEESGNLIGALTKSVKKVAKGTVDMFDTEFKTQDNRAISMTS